MAESIAVVVTAVDTAMRQLLQGLTPALLQVQLLQFMINTTCETASPPLTRSALTAVSWVHLCRWCASGCSTS